MIQQAIKITRHDIQFEMRTKNAELVYNNASQPSSNTKTTKGELSVVQNTPASLSVDTYASRKVMGFSKVADMVSESATAGQQNALNYMKQTAQTGTALSNIQNGTEIQDIISQRFSSTLPTTSFTYSPGADISWSPHVYKTAYQPGSVTNDWTIDEPTFDYVPGEVTMEITQMPSVEIEYVGKPLYFPRSYAEKFE